MDVKIVCSCGQHYAFEVEPVGGLMPVRVACPACGTDGTAAANEFLSQSAPAVAPLRVGGARLQVATASEHVAAPAGPPPGPPPAMATLRSSRAPESSGRSSLIRGLAACLAAGVAGMVGWFVLTKTTNTEFGIAAWGIGLLVGAACRKLANNTTQGLGVMAAICTAIAILAGQFLVAKSVVGEFSKAFAEMGVEFYTTYAQEAVKKVPTGSDTEVRAFLAEQNVEDGEKADPSKVSADEIREFKEEMPVLREIAGGKKTKPQIEQILSDQGAGSLDSFELFRASLSWWTLLWLVLGVGSAYKLASGSDG